MEKHYSPSITRNLSLTGKKYEALRYMARAAREGHVEAYLDIIAAYECEIRGIEQNQGKIPRRSLENLTRIGKNLSNLKERLPKDSEDRDEAEIGLEAIEKLTGINLVPINE